VRIPIQIERSGAALLGMFHVTSRPTQGSPLLLVNYGLNGDRVDNHSLSVLLAEKANLAGISVLRYDYAGCGVSGGEFPETSISSKLEDAQAMLRFMRGCQNEQPCSSERQGPVLFLQKGMLVCTAGPLLSVLERGFLRLNDRPTLRQARVQRNEVPLLRRQRVIQLDRLHWAHRNTRRAIDTLQRVDDHETRPFMETMHRADIRTVGVLTLDTRFGDYVRQTALLAEQFGPISRGASGRYVLARYKSRIVRRSRVLAFHKVPISADSDRSSSINRASSITVGY
jgi:hypothetical protein